MWGSCKIVNISWPLFATLVIGRNVLTQKYTLQKWSLNTFSSVNSLFVVLCTLCVKMKTFLCEESVLRHNKRNCFPSYLDHYLNRIIDITTGKYFSVALFWMVTLQDFRQARAKVTVYQQGQIIRASVATATKQNIEKLKINSRKTQIVILVPRFLSSFTGPRTGTWKRCWNSDNIESIQKSMNR